MKLNPQQLCITVVMVSLSLIAGCARAAVSPARNVPIGGSIKLPAPRLNGSMSVEKALDTRRSVRSYADAPLSIAEVGQLLWAAQGITDPKTGHRTAPSAMAVYPMTVYLVAGKVTGLAPGVYRYEPKDHSIVKIMDGDKRSEMVANGGQPTFGKAPVDLVIAGDYGKMAAKMHGSQASSRFVDIEAGHVAENVCLQATALDLGTVTAAGFNQDKLKETLALPSAETPIYVMPVGKLPK
jgi:SagB-type dehydrogenase family enzyme